MIDHDDYNDDECAGQARVGREDGEEDQAGGHARN